MGDKISQLPAATTVDGTELVPIVQGGATKKVTGAILRSPVGVAGGDLTGTFPNPTLAAVTTAQIGVGSGSAIPVLTVDEKGRVTSLTTVANPALTTAQIAGLTTSTPAALSTTPTAGLSTSAARADHAHLMPSAADVGALGATAAAGGDLVGNFPNPTLAAITTAQSNVGSSSVVPVLSVDAKGRVTSLTTAAVQAVSTTAITALTGDVTAAGPGSAAATLAAITTAQSNVGSGTLVPVLSIDAKGRVTALSSTPISGSAGGTVVSITAGTGLDGGTITTSGTISLASVTTAQSNVGSASQVPVLSINAQGQVTALSSVAITTSSGAPLTTEAPAALATAPVVGLSSAAARADHQHVFPTASEVGALGATAAAGGDLTGNFPNPTLAAVTTAQSNVGSSTAIPVVSVDAKGRVTGLTTVQINALTTNEIAGLSTTTPAALATSAFAGLSSFAARADHQHLLPTASEIGALTTVQIAGLSTVAPAALATSAVAGLSTFAARADHQHLFPTAAQVGALGATAAASGDLTGNYPAPTLAAITTAKTNIGSSTVVPVLSIDAKGRVTSLTTTAISAATTSAISSLTGDVTATGPGAAAATLAAITTAQSNVGSDVNIPVLSIDAKGRVTSLSSVVAAFAVIQGTALIVAGGGGASGGGGGAGGFIETSISLVLGTVYTATVGAGGAGSSYPTPGSVGANGVNSSFSSNTAIGGGGGGKWGAAALNANPGQNGGSGGGAGTNTTTGQPSSGGSGTVGQGNNGGATPGLTGSPSGGGGGAGAVGAAGISTSGGNGGVGLQSSITGSATFYAGGGGGAFGGATQGTGGSGGGGTAAQTTGGAGTANTGGGGGGAWGSPATGGNGGSGVVILSIPTSKYTGVTTGSPTVTTSGSNTIIKFTSSGTYTA